MSAHNRRDIIDKTTVGIYHCYNKVVRGLFLTGYDPVQKKDFSYRRGWIADRVEELAGLFGIDVLFVAFLANHFHLILRNRPDLVKRWSDHEVIRRAIKIFPAKFRRLGIRGEPNRDQIQKHARNKKLVEDMRERLSDISWFMRQLEQYAARRINEDVGHGGTVWQHRFKSRRILDETGLIICGVYVDLNQIRAGEVDRPESSKFTSAYFRLKGLKARNQGGEKPWSHDGWLSPIQLKVGDSQDGYPKAGKLEGMRASDKGVTDMTLENYFSLLDWTGRQQRKGKRGKIPSQLPPILERLGLTADQWLHCVKEFDELFGLAVGKPASLKKEAERLELKRLRCIRQVEKAFAQSDD